MAVTNLVAEAAPTRIALPAKLFMAPPRDLRSQGVQMAFVLVRANAEPLAEKRDVDLALHPAPTRSPDRLDDEP